MLKTKINELITLINLNVLPLFIFYVILRSRAVYKYLVSRIDLRQAVVIVVIALLEAELTCYYNPLGEQLLVSATVIRNSLLAGLLFGSGAGWLTGLLGGLLALAQGTEPLTVKLTVMVVATVCGFLAECYKKRYGNIWVGRTRALIVALVLFASALLTVDIATYLQGGQSVFYHELSFSVGKLTGFLVLLFFVQRIIIEREHLAGYDLLAGEMRLARQLQLDIVARPERTAVDNRLQVAGVLCPAKEVGGDWYDYFALGADKYCFVVADVSGKGVPAALFMVVGCMLFRGFKYATFAADPAKIMEQVNTDLCDNNGAKLFITAVCAIIDVATGELVYCNVGHPSIYLKRAAGPLSALPVTNKGLLGYFRNKRYNNTTVQLQKADMLMLYTDGVTEAQNLQNELFGKERLEALLGKHFVAPSELCATTVAAVNRYSAGMEQSDDITVLAVKYTADGEKI